MENTLYAEDWSHDGASLLCVDRDSHRLIVLPLTGETNQRSVLDTAYTKNSFRFSPDGRWVVYQSTESGASEIFVAAFPSFAEKRQVSSGGGFAPSWRRDGKEIFFVTPGRRVMGAEIKTGSRIEAGIPKELFQLPRTGGASMNLASARDGTRFLALEVEQRAEDPQVLVAVNWTADLK